MEFKQPVKVVICDPEHPHYPESGELTGDVIRFPWGGQMAKMKLAACAHGTDACYISPGQAQEIREAPPKRRRRA